MKRNMLMRITLGVMCFLFGNASDIQGSDSTTDIPERIASLTPSYKTQVVFNNQLELIGYDIFSDGLKLSQTNSEIVALKRGKPFNIRYYWRYIDRLVQIPSLHALFVNNVPIKTTHGVSHKFESQVSKWQDVRSQSNGAFIGHTFWEEHTYLLPDQYLMWAPDLALRLNDMNYKGVLSLKFDDTEGAFNYGTQYLRLGNVDAALAEFVFFSEQADSTHTMLMQNMIELFQNKALLEQRDWRIYYCLGHVARLKKQWKESENYFQKSLALNASLGDVYFYAAKALVEQGQKARALDMVQKGLLAAPQNAYLLSERARLNDAKDFPAYIIENDWRGMTGHGYLFSYGAVWQKLRLLGGQYKFKFHLRGVPAVDVWPHVIIQIDGERIYEDDVRSRDPVVVEIDHALNTGEHVVAVWFTNNTIRTNAAGETEDADLYVDRCEILPLFPINY